MSGLPCRAAIDAMLMILPKFRAFMFPETISEVITMPRALTA